MKEELEKALKQSLNDGNAKIIIERINSQMAKWGLKMPDVPPLVFDFGRGDVFNIGETEFWIANELEHGYCGKYMFLLKGQTCPEHFHNIKHETFFIVKGLVRMNSGEKSWNMTEGDTYAMVREKSTVLLPLRTHLFLKCQSRLLLQIMFF